MRAWLGRYAAWLTGFKAGGVSLICALLAACAAPAPIQPSGVVNIFSCTGRFALIITQEEGEQKAVQGGFSWLESDSGYILDLTNPLGSIEARVESRAGKVVLTKADGTRFEASDADTLIAQALGSKVPVAGLRYWLRGLVAADSQPSRVARDSLGRPVAFEQDGWLARLSNYDTLGPRLLMFERSEAGRRIVMRLAVNRVPP